ncbi:MAG: hypothetical protein JSU86_03200 [Phycisphaerales bacterium]|nr:MAG: hypothetical protein JSU86_03200 [Phycisphaerales bacterium]
MGRLLVSVRGSNEALAAAEGGAHIADVEYPGSALGTPYPLNIRAVRQRLDEAGFKDMPISTNIGEEQPVRSTGLLWSTAMTVGFRPRRSFATQKKTLG